MQPVSHDPIETAAATCGRQTVIVRACLEKPLPGSESVEFEDHTGTKTGIVSFIGAYPAIFFNPEFAKSQLAT